MAQGNSNFEKKQKKSRFSFSESEERIAAKKKKSNKHVPRVEFDEFDGF